MAQRLQAILILENQSHVIETNLTYKNNKQKMNMFEYFKFLIFLLF